MSTHHLAKKQCVYLDYNATTPVDPRVVDAMLPYFTEEFGNPSSKHCYGKTAAFALEKARQAVAAAMEAPSSSIYFTSGATESLNWAIKGAAWAQRKAKRGTHILTSSLEHAAVYEILNFLKEEGFEYSVCPVNAQGFLEISTVEEYLKETTSLVTFILANAEIGSIQPITQISKVIKQRSPHCLLHVDASQALGKIPISVKKLAIDLLTVAGHKCYAPKGIGALYIHTSCLSLPSLIHGGGQENRLRGGTENVPLCVGFGKACALISKQNSTQEMSTLLSSSYSSTSFPPSSSPSHFLTSTIDEAIFSMHLYTCCKLLKSTLWDTLKTRTHMDDFELQKYLRFNNSIEERSSFLPNTLSVSIWKAEGVKLVEELQPFLCISTGSACHANTSTLSSSLAAVGCSEEWGLGTLRLSTGRFTTQNDAMWAGNYLAKFLIEKSYIPVKK